MSLRALSACGPDSLRGAYLVFAKSSAKQVEDIESNKFADLRAIEASHCHVELATFSLDPAWVFAEQKIFSGMPYDGFLMCGDGYEWFGESYGFWKQVFRYGGIKFNNIKLDECFIVFICNVTEPL